MGGSSQASDMTETTGQGHMGQGFDQNQGNLGRGFDSSGALLTWHCPINARNISQLLNVLGCQPSSGTRGYASV